jgi:hypothetical protein
VPEQWLRSDEWVRASRGRTWAFRLPTDAIIDVLHDVARRRGEAFSLLQCERVQDGRAWLSTYRELPVEALTLDGPWQYLIRSRTLQPAIPAPERRSGVGWPAEFAVNGLILLHHPEPGRSEGPAESRVGIVNRIANERTGAMHEHREADALYATVKRALRSAEREHG